MAQIERLRRAIDHAAELAGLRWTGTTKSDARRIDKTRRVLDARDERKRTRAAERAAKVAAREEARAAREAAREAKRQARAAREDERLARSLAKTNKRTRKARALEAKRAADARELEREREKLRAQSSDGANLYDVDPWSFDRNPCTGAKYADYKAGVTFGDAAKVLSFREGSKGRPSPRKVIAEMARQKRQRWADQLHQCAHDIGGAARRIEPEIPDDEVPF